MLNRGIKVITAAAILINGTYLTAGENDDIKVLVEQGKNWTALGKKKQAGDVWKKLLLIEPNNVDALYGLAQLELEEQRLGSAQQYLDKLIQVSPDSKQTIALEQELKLASGSQGGLLAEARQYAKNNDAEKAVERYRNLFGNKLPQGRLALEYYLVLRTTPEGWEEAKDGLARLYRQSPGDSTVAIPYAQTLTWRVATRRQGIRLLAQLAHHKATRAQATDSWRNAFTMPGPPLTAEDKKLIKDYLALNPEDSEIRKLLSQPTELGNPSLTRSQPAKNAEASASELGMAALENQNDKLAESEFNAILARHPRDHNALGGLGIIRMRQGRHQEAKQLLSKAASINRLRWNEALRSANYWSEIQDAQQAKQRGDAYHAQTSFLAANQAYPAGLEAKVGLANLALDAGKWGEAEKIYQDILTAHPDNADALSGLLVVYMQTNRQSSASKMLSNLPATMTSKPEVVQSLRKGYAEKLANSAKQPNLNVKETQARLEEALRYDPQNRWIKLNLAYHYFNAGRKPEARGLIDGLLAEDASNTDALYAYSLFAADVKRWDLATQGLMRIPEGQRTPEAQALYRRVWIHGQIDRAMAQSQQGQLQSALSTLQQSESYAWQDPELLVALSGAYADLKEPQRGLELMRAYISKMPQGSTDALLQYANILTRTNQDVEANSIVQELQRRPLTTDQRKQLEGLQIGMNIRRAESLREAGDLVSAYDTLRPALLARPNDPGVLGALARMYSAANDHQNALALYQRVIAQSPSDASVYLSAAQASVQLGDQTRAEHMIDEAVRVEPENTKILTEAGRLYRSVGKTAKARESLMTASKLTQSQSVQPMVTGANLPSGNPFMALAGQRHVNMTVGSQDNPFMRIPQTMSSPMQTGQTNQMQSYQMQANQIQPNQLQPNQLQPQYIQTAPYSNPMPAKAEMTPTPWMSAPTPEPAPVANQWQPSGQSPVMELPFAYRPYSGTANTGYNGQVNRRSSDWRTRAKAKSGRRNVSNRYRDRMGASAVQPYSAAGQSSQSVLMQPPLPSETYGQPSNSGRNGQSMPAEDYATYPTMQNSSGYNGAVPPRYTTPAPAGMSSLAPAPVAAYQTPMNRPLQTSAYPPASTQLPVATGNKNAAEAELAKIQMEDNVTFRAGVLGRTRTGEPGLSKLREVQLPIDVSMPAGEGKLVGHVTPVELSAGAIESSFDANSRFGAGPAASGTRAVPKTVTGTQNASGVGIGIGYRGSNVSANLATTPIGFEKTNVVGNVKLTGNLDSLPPVSYSVDLNRVAVTDSVLSYAGSKDPRTGDTWGGVVASGINAQIGTDNGGYGLYGYGSWHALTGDNVEKNTRYSVGAGAYSRLIDLADSRLTAGVNLGGIFYDKNLRYFTFGHGGYFSPQSYLAVTLPVTYAKRTTNLSWVLGGQVGLQTFSEDNADFFPTDAARQKLAVTALNNNGQPGSNAGIYAGQTQRGLVYGLNSQAEYKLGQNFVMGGLLNVSNAGDFREWNGGVYLRYTMYPVITQAELPLSPYLSPYAVRY